MTQNEALHTRVFNNGIIAGNIIEMDFERKYNFKKRFLLKYLSSIRGYFINDCLTSILIESEKVKPNDFDYLVTDCIRLNNEFYRIYEKPDVNNKASYTSFDDSGVQVLYNYHIQGKKYKGLAKDITIELRKKDYDFWYFIQIFSSTTNRNNAKLSGWIEQSKGGTDDIEIYSF